jgi:hypothetical protein
MLARKHERDNLEDLEVNVRTILNQLIKKYDGRT